MPKSDRGYAQGKDQGSHPSKLESGDTSHKAKKATKPADPKNPTNPAPQWNPRQGPRRDEIRS